MFHVRQPVGDEIIVDTFNVLLSLLTQIITSFEQGCTSKLPACASAYLLKGGTSNGGGLPSRLQVQGIILAACCPQCPFILETNCVVMADKLKALCHDKSLHQPLIQEALPDSKALHHLEMSQRFNAIRVKCVEVVHVLL